MRTPMSRSATFWWISLLAKRVRATSVLVTMTSVSAAPEASSTVLLMARRLCCSLIMRCPR